MPPVLSAAEHYAARIDAVLAQRTRLRGPEPGGDLFAGLSPASPVFRSDPRREPDLNLQTLASCIEPDDVIVDVGGGAGRISLPLALRCKQVVNVDPSAAMGAGFLSSAEQAGIKNVEFIAWDWENAAAPAGTVALVNHVTYLTRDIVPFLSKLERSGRRRVIITVASPPPPWRQHRLYELVYEEPEEAVPGLVELVNVLWEMGRLPDVRVLPLPVNPVGPSPDREAAIRAAVERFSGEQWALWPMGEALEQRVRTTLERDFESLFYVGPQGVQPLWYDLGPEVLITWEPKA